MNNFMQKKINRSARNKAILFLSLPLVVSMIFVSSAGILTPDFYSAETLNWQSQSIWQDMIDLFLIVPCLLVTSVLAYRNSKSAMPEEAPVINTFFAIFDLLDY